MTSPGAYSAGTAYLDVIPSFDGVQKAIAKEARRMEQALGKDAGKEFGKGFEENATRAVDKALGTSKDRAAKAGKESGDQYGGHFAEGFKKAMAGVQREFKTIKLDAKFDDAALQKKFRSLKGDIERLGKINIGANMDAGPAFREMAKVETKLRELQDYSVELELRDNLGAVAAKFEAFRKDVEKTARFDVEPDFKLDANLGAFATKVRAQIESALKNIAPVDFTADVTPAQAKLMELRQEMIALGDLKIGVGISGAGAIAEIERIRIALEAVADDDTIALEVRSDALRTAAELAAVKKEVEALDKRQVKIRVDADTSLVDRFRGSLRGLRSEITSAGNSGQEGANAFRAFNGVILAATTLLPAAIPLVGALAGGLALLGPMALGAGAGLGVTALAFGGISDAVKAMGKVEDNRVKDSQANAKKMATASESVADAQRGLQRAEDTAARSGIASQRAVTDARESAARAAEQAARAVSDARENEARVQEDSARSIAQALETQQAAEEALGDAQDRVKDAQEALTQARRDAQEQQEDATLALRDSRLDAEKAEIDLIKAEQDLRALLATGQGDMSDEDWGIALRSAQLDVDRYRLAIDTANERTGDLTEKTEEFARTGVEGSKEVIDARRGVADAEDGVRDAQQRVQDAVASVARAQADASRAQADAARATADAVAAQDRARVDGQRAIADAEATARQQQLDGSAAVNDAQRNLTDAQRRYSDALFETGTLGSESMQALELSMDRLGPAGQRFATFIFGIKDQLRDLRDTAQAGVLPGVEDAIDMLLTRNGPGLKQFISDMAYVVGDLFRKAGELFTSPQWQAIFDVWSQSAPIFMEQFGDIGLALLTFFGELFRGLAPYAVQFGDNLVALAENSADWMATFVDSQTFMDIMNWLFTEGPKVWDTMVNVGKAIGAILIALAPLGALVLDLIDFVARAIAAMDPQVLGAILTVFLGMVASFQVAMAAMSLSVLIIDGALAPLAGWILLIGAVVTALVVLYTQNETFRNIVDAVFHFIADIAVWLFDNVLKPYFEYGVWIWGNLIDYYKWAWENILKPVFEAIGAIATWLYQEVLSPVFTFIGEAFGVLVNAMKWTWDNVLNPLFNIIAEVAKWLLIILTVVVFGPILAGWELLMMSLKMLWDVTGKPLFEAVAAVAEWLWKDKLELVFMWIGNKWDEIMNAMSLVYDNILKPMFDKFGEGIGVLADLFGKGVDAMGAAWDLIKEKTRGPINFVIGTVINGGLLKAFNSIIGALNLPESWKVADVPLVDAPPSSSGPTQSGRGGRQIALAAGGPVPGWSPNDVADNIPAMLTADEHVMPRKRVRQYGMDFLESLRHGQIDPQAARSLMQPRGYAAGGPVYQQVFSAVKSRFPRARMNSAYRPGDPGLHGQGLAVDLGEEGFSGGAGRPYLAAMNRDLYDRAGKFLYELIYTGTGDDRADLKAGNPLNYGPATNAAHTNHVHVGVKDIAGFLKAYGAGDGGGILGAAGNLLGGIWDSVGGVFSSLKDSLTAPLRDLAGQFGDTGLARIAGGVASDLPGKMWEKIKGSVGDAWEGLQSTASGAFNWVVDKVTGGNTMETVRSAAEQRGWGSGAEWSALQWIINKESGGNPKAQNPTSTASGLFQHINSTWMANKPASSAARRMADASVADQAIGGMNYFASRYGSPSAAKRFWENNGYYSEGGPVSAGGGAEAPTLYDTGGALPPGITTVLNASNKPEQILTSQQWNDILAGNQETVGGDAIGELHLHQVVFDPSEAVAEVNHWAQVYSNGGRYATARRGN